MWYKDKDYIVVRDIVGIDISTIDLGVALNLAVSNTSLIICKNGYMVPYDGEICIDDGRRGTVAHLFAYFNENQLYRLLVPYQFDFLINCFDNFCDFCQFFNLLVSYRRTFNIDSNIVRFRRSLCDYEFHVSDDFQVNFAKFVFFYGSYYKF